MMKQYYVNWSVEGILYFGILEKIFWEFGILENIFLKI